jgi:hypothetical protein
MVNKKAQSQLITSVLIILLVVVAIIIVWKVVGGVVGTSSDALKKTTDCLTIDLEISQAIEGGNLKLQRGVDETETLMGVTIYIDGAKLTQCATTIEPGEAKKVCTDIKIPVGSQGQKIQFRKMVGEDYEDSSVCEFDGESDKGVEGNKGYTIRDGECNVDMLDNCDESGECGQVAGYGWNSTLSECYKLPVVV